MKSSFSRPLNRRRVLELGLGALALPSLNACGGGSGGDVLGGSPGIGGTGFFSSGSISGFGSVIVNSITFDDTNANVLLDGVSATSADLRLGMVADVVGSKGTASGTGVAQTIAVWSIAQGAVSNVQTNQFMVDDMVIQTNSATVWDGIASTAQLTNGLRVTVWGLQNGADPKRWTATRVALVTPTTPVRPTTNHSNRRPAVGDDVDLEGFVTALLPSYHFMLGNTEIDASGNPATIAVAMKLKIGERIHVDGSWKGSILLATEIHDSEGVDYDNAHLEGVIDLFTSIANFVVRGQRCDATNAKWEHGSPALLRQGVKVKLEGKKAGDVLMVTEIEIKSDFLPPPKSPENH